jgi:hypothetical protein
MQEEIRYIEYKINKYAQFLHDFRIVPRSLVVGYSYLVWDVIHWFMALENPTTQQAMLITTVVGISAAVFGLYTNTTSGVKK